MPPLPAYAGLTFERLAIFGEARRLSDELTLARSDYLFACGISRGDQHRARAAKRPRIYTEMM
jgi:hypothetical protein